MVMVGKCAICGYHKNIQALEMHHINREEKEFTFANANKYHNWEDISEEMKKCILLCCNCHREIHYPDKDTNFTLKTSYYKKRDTEIILSMQRKSKEYFCVDCGKKISRNRARCQKCAELHNRKVVRPNREDFKKEIKEKSFISLGKKYGLSDNAIRKWCDSFKLPWSKTEINNYSDLEWNSL